MTPPSVTVMIVEKAKEYKLEWSLPKSRQSSKDEYIVQKCKLQHDVDSVLAVINPIR